MGHDFDDFDEDFSSRPNKAEIKRKMAQYFVLAEKFTTLTVKDINFCEFNEELELAIIEARTMPLKEARKRQLKFIAKLFRSFEIEELENLLADADSKKTNVKRVVEKKEEQIILDELLNLSEDNVQAFCEKYPDADRQRLRNFIRNISKSDGKDKSKKYYEEAKNYIRLLIK